MGKYLLADGKESTERCTCQGYVCGGGVWGGGGGGGRCGAW